MEVIGQIHSPVALLPTKLPPLSVGWETVWARDLVWKLWRKEKHLVPFPAAESRFVCNPARIRGAALAKLSRQATVIKTSGVNREIIFRMMETERVFDTVEPLLTRG